MKYGLCIVLTILLIMIIIEIKQESEYISAVGHHIKAVEELDQELDNIINENSLK